MRTHPFSALILLAMLLAGPAQARNEGSEILQSGLASIVMSPLLSLQGEPVEASAALGLGTGLTVVGIVTVAGEGSKLTLEKAGDGSRYVVRVSEGVMTEVGVTVGASVRAMPEATGYALVASGKLLAFIPNEVGMALLHQSRIAAE
ncbi:hypothetical protein [Chitinilyticum aquatile]|uniref:hypothetical protein n=1 Tax=Chitinilyticum aquatile TaxID=362520 RepID=UPI00040CC077|nr:hypothetical protein [Chitinilyticum aquatile]